MASPDQEVSVSFEEFVQACSPRLFRTALLLAGQDRAAAEDLLQLALERAYRHWARVCRTGEPERYVQRILANASNDRWRQVARDRDDPGREDHLRRRHQQGRPDQHRHQHGRQAHPPGQPRGSPLCRDHALSGSAAGCMTGQVPPGIAVPALVYRLRAGLLLSVAALGLALVPVALAVMTIPVAAVPVALVPVGPVAGVLARVTRAPPGGAGGSRAGANTVARHDRGVVAPAGAAMTQDRRVPGALVDIDDDAPVRGSQRDLPHRA